MRSSAFPAAAPSRNRARHSAAATLYLGYNAGGSGSYALGGGSLSAPQQYVGYSGSGSFTQTAGTNSATSYLAVGYNGSDVGSYNLSGGSLLAKSIHRLFRQRQLHTDRRHELRDNGTVHRIFLFPLRRRFVQPRRQRPAGRDELRIHRLLRQRQLLGGTNSIGGLGYLYLGYNPGGFGTYALSGGTLSTADEFVGNAGSGIFTQSGGTNSASYLYVATNAGAMGTYTLSGSGYLAASNIYVGSFGGTGSFTQSGGTNSVASTIEVGYGAGSSGAYYLTGGLLSPTNVYIGNGGAASFVQSGGTNAVSNGLTLSGSGSYNLSSGQLSAPYEYIGFGGTAASFTQSGGTNSTTNPLIVGFSPGTSGTYSLSGGSLECPPNGLDTREAAATRSRSGTICVRHHVLWTSRQQQRHARRREPFGGI